MVWKLENVTHLPAVVTNGTDRAAPQAGRLGRRYKGSQGNGRVHGGVEECVQVVVGKFYVVPLVQLALPPVVAAEYQEPGRFAGPVTLRKQACYSSTLLGAFEHDDVSLLQVTFGRGA